MSFTVTSGTNPIYDPSLGSGPDGPKGSGRIDSTGSGISGSTSGPGGVPPQSNQQTQVGGTNTTGNQPTNSTESQRRLNEAPLTLEQATKLLQELVKSLRDPDQLAALLIEMNDLQRKNALDQRLASRDTAKSQLEGQAQETRESAIKELASAAVAVALAVVSFAVSVGGALKMGSELKTGMSATMSAGKMSDEVSTMQGNMGKMVNHLDEGSKLQMTSKIGGVQNQADTLRSMGDMAVRKSDMINTYTQAINSLVRGVSDALSTSLRAFAKFDEAQGQVLAANAEDTKADADQIKEFMNSIEELLKSALEFMQKLNDAEVELMASASRL